MAEPFFEVCTVAQAYMPYRWNHEPGVARLPNGNLLAVWAVTGREPYLDEIVGSMSSDHGRTWSSPTLLASHPEAFCRDAGLLVTDNKVFLLYSLQRLAPRRPGDPYRRYLGADFVQKVSTDNGQTWSDPTPVLTGHKNSQNPHEGIVLRDGSLVWPWYWERGIERGDQPFERDTFQTASVLRSVDGGATWSAGGNAMLPGDKGAPEPAVVELCNGDLFMLARTTLGRLYEARSSDKGQSWSPLAPSPLVSPSAPAALFRLSGEPSKVVVVWNNTNRPFARRYPLDIAISDDDCRTWSHSMTISSPGTQVSYPGVTMADDGHIIVVYQQWHNTYYADHMDYTDIFTDITCARFNEEWLRVGAFVSPRT